MLRSNSICFVMQPSTLVLRRLESSGFLIFPFYIVHSLTFQTIGSHTEQIRDWAQSPHSYS